MGRVENKASLFLNALKGSNLFVQRQQQQHAARDSAHPYKRPLTDGFDKPKGPLLGMLSKSPQKQIAPVFVKRVTCKVAMISPVRFEVQPSFFHAQLIEVFKTIPSKAYGKLGFALF